MNISIDKPIISVIIPAFNERECIVDTLMALNKFSPHERYEILVVDNGSEDDTAALAEREGANVIHHPEGTIASVRNKGVSQSSGEVLIFLDADVIVTSSWAIAMKEVVRELNENPMLVTGSRCLPPDDGNWFNRYWFSRLVEYEAPYVNSGHMITSRKLFDCIQGFSEELKTAEDYDFCMKAKKAGADVKNNSGLPVIHTGYPKTLSAFIQRERWHGREDFESFASFSESKVGWVALFNLLLFVMCCLSAIATASVSPVFIYTAIMYFVSVLLTVYKFKSFGGEGLIPTAAIFNIYLWGRSFSLLDRLVASVRSA